MIYAVAETGTGYVKIGVTKGNLDVRVADLQIGNPRPLRVVAAFSSLRLLEKELHHHLARYRRFGEWFDFEGVDPEATIKATVEQLSSKYPKLKETTILPTEKGKHHYVYDEEQLARTANALAQLTRADRSDFVPTRTILCQLSVHFPDDWDNVAPGAAPNALAHQLRVLDRRCTSTTRYVGKNLQWGYRRSDLIRIVQRYEVVEVHNHVQPAAEDRKSWFTTLLRSSPRRPKVRIDA